MLRELKSEPWVKKETEADRQDMEVLSVPLTQHVNVVLQSTILKRTIVIRLLWMLRFYDRFIDALAWQYLYTCFSLAAVMRCGMV
jgi:hypothetical protein